MRRAALVLVAGCAALLTACSSETAGQPSRASSDSCIGAWCTATIAAAPITAANPASRVVTVPDLAGLDGNGASAALSAAGVLDVRFALNDAPMTNKVTGQSPPPGTSQRATATVYVALLGPDGRITPPGPNTVVTVTAAPVPAAPAMTTSQANAVRKAESYLDYAAFSRTGLIKQLQYEGFSAADATYAVDHIIVDWTEQADKKAASYISYSAFSRSGLIKQLQYEGFTADQAAHGAKSVGL